jgi:hypothetical protein
MVDVVIEDTRGHDDLPEFFGPIATGEWRALRGVEWLT